MSKSKIDLNEILLWLCIRPTLTKVDLGSWFQKSHLTNFLAISGHFLVIFFIFLNMKQGGRSCTGALVAPAEKFGLEQKF